MFNRNAIFLDELIRLFMGKTDTFIWSTCLEKNLSTHKTTMQFPIFFHSLLPGWKWMVFVDAKTKTKLRN